MWSRLNNISRFLLAGILLGLPGLACIAQGLAPSDLEQGVLFQDSFSDPTSGWTRAGPPDETPGQMAYEKGAYRIRVDSPGTSMWSVPGFQFSDAIIEVSARAAAGPEDNNFGIVCRYVDDGNFYFFIISSDGYFGIGKNKDGIASLIEMESMRYSPTINFGIDATNQIRADCIGNTLSLSVNNTRLIKVEDSDFTSGDAGLIAGAFENPGVDVRFDDFLVRQPE